MVKVAVLASGNGSNFQNLVEKSQGKNYLIKLLIVDKEDAYAIKRAKNLNIPCYIVIPKNFSNKSDYEKKIIEILKENRIELIALAGYMRIISLVLLKAYENKIINIHPSYLPNFPGKESIKDAFEEKTKNTGVTIHYVDEGIDSGKIIYQEKIKIEKNWDLKKLEEEIHKIEHKIYPIVLSKFGDKNYKI